MILPIIIFLVQGFTKQNQMPLFKRQQPQSLTYIQVQQQSGTKYLQLESGTTKQSAQKQITIGRTHDNIIQILDNTISKKHSKIVYVNEQHYLTDLDSANGVMVNGKKIKKNVAMLLNNEDKIQFGKCKFQCQYQINCYINIATFVKIKEVLEGKVEVKQIQKIMFLTNKSTKNQLFNKKKDSDHETQKPVTKKQKRKVKESKIKLPDFTDFLRLQTFSDNKNVKVISQKQNQRQEQLCNKTFIRTPGLSKPKQGRIKLNAFSENNFLSESDLEKHKLSQRQKNIYQQQQQSKMELERKQKAMKENQLKMQIQRAKQSEDLLQRQLILSEKVRQQQEQLQKQRQKLEKQFVRKQKEKREAEMQNIKSMEQKQRQMIHKMEEQRQQQIKDLQQKQQKFKKESEMQYRTEYEKRKQQLEIEATALAQNYEKIYRQTIQKVRTQIENQQQTIEKMQNKQNILNQENQSLQHQIQATKQRIQYTKKDYIQIHGRNRAYVLYASQLQDKIDGLAMSMEDKIKEDGYYRPLGDAISSNTKKMEQSIINSRKLLKIKKKQYDALWEETVAIRGLIRQQNYSSGIVQDVNDYLDTITDNMQKIQKLKEQYLQQIQAQTSIQDLWEVQLEQYSQCFQKNRVLQAQINKNARQIDQNIRDQIKKSTQQRLHLLKAMHYCPEQKKSAAKFLIEQMLNIEQENHKYFVQNQEYHKKIVKVITQSEKNKRQNQLLSEILFGQDQNGHHFDNMKLVINNLIESLQQQKIASNIANCIKLSQEGLKLQLLIQQQIEKKKRIKQSMRKIGQMGLAPQQLNNLQKNPMVFFGDLLTSKQLEVDQKKLSIQHMTKSNTVGKQQIKLLEQKRKKISESLDKFKKEQLLEAKKYLSQ